MLKDIAKLATFESQKEVVGRTHLRNLKKERLRRKNQCDKDRCTAESAQQREAWFNSEMESKGYRAQQERVLGYRSGRLASETPDQRTSRLELG